MLDSDQPAMHSLTFPLLNLHLLGLLYPLQPLLLHCSLRQVTRLANFLQHLLLTVLMLGLVLRLQLPVATA